MEAQLEQTLASYVPSQAATGLVKSTRILLLVGVSGAGKDTIKHRLLQKPEYHHIVSHTTRAPRLNHGVLEQDGVDYHFIRLAKAEEMLAGHEFIEAKMYSGNVYGTSVAEIQAAHDRNDIAITDLEVQGVVEYKNIASEVTAVFILPPSYEIWQERLLRRYEGHPVDEADLAKRMQAARDELQHALETDYFHFIINDDLGETVAQIDHIAHHRLAPQREEKAHTLASELLAELRARL